MRLSLRPALPVLAALAFSLALASAAVSAAPKLKAGIFEPARAAPEFRLAGSDGAELNLARFRGKLVLLVFGFTHCPEVCPTTLATLAQARAALGAEAARGLQVVYITVDPQRDSLDRIGKYLKAFDPSFIGGTGAPAVLEGVQKSYGVFARKLEDAGENYGMNHSTSVFLIDREGRLRALMPYGKPAADFVHDARLLLAASR